MLKILIFTKKAFFSIDIGRTRRRILRNRSIAESFDQVKVFHTPHVIQRPFLYYRNDDVQVCRSKYESNARSSTRALRDRRLNSLYRRIIANENIGCAGITNGRGTDEMHDRATFRPISSTKNILRPDFLLRFKNRSCYRQYEQSTIYLHVIVSLLG